MIGNCKSCAAFAEVADGKGPCLASGVEFYDEDSRGQYTMVAWCDGCTCWSKDIRECLEKRKTYEEEI